MELAIAHHHGFKCAGSSVVHLLNRAWPGRVLHIEHRLADRRIHCGRVRDLVAVSGHMALTSHLLTLPPPGEAFAHVHFGLVRDPIARLVSAYKFVPEERKAGGFVEFVKMHEHHACNFHVRHLVVPDGEAGDWRARPEAVPLGAPHVLIGLVERFADSMFLLERRLAAVGVAFDGSVAAAHNVGRGDGPQLEDEALVDLRLRNREDYELYDRVGEALDAELAAVDPDGDGRAEHRARCEARTGRTGRTEAYLGIGPTGWTYLDD